jgi:hypothetical protein
VIVLDSDYDRARAGAPLPHPWPRELAHHGDLGLGFGADIGDRLAVWYRCSTCGRQGLMVALPGGADDPEQLASLAAYMLAGQACVD